MQAETSTELEIVQVDGESRLDSRLIARNLGIEHEVFIRTLRKYQIQMEELGLIRFQSEGNGSNPRLYVMLNQDHALFSILLARNTEQTLQFRLEIIQAFRKATDAQIATNIKVAAEARARFTNFIDEWISGGNDIPQVVKGPLEEKRIEIALKTSLESKGIHVQSQVKCEIGIADLVTSDTIYEIKDVLTQSNLQKAITQVLAYRVCINPQSELVVVGKRHNKPINVKFAEKLGVEVLFWED